jgi:hypothetical protein
MVEEAAIHGTSAAPRKPWYTVFYIQVLIAIVLGVLVGHFFPQTGNALKPLGDAFINLIKMMIAPVIFCTVVHGISSMGDLKKIGRVGIKTLFYFEAVSTLALGIGLLMGEVLQPGAGFNIDPATLDAKTVASYVGRAAQEGVTTHLMNIIPNTFVGAFAGGDLLQVDSVRRAANYLKRHRHSSSERSRPASSKAASAVTSNREIGNAHVGMQFGRRHLSSSGKFFGEPDLAARGVVVSREKGLKSRQDCVLQDFASLVRAHRSFILP